MSETLYYIICILLSTAVLIGISLMSNVKTAVLGNMISAASVLIGVIVTLLYKEVLSVWSIYIFILIGILIGATLALRVKMIQMPQLVALLNGVGGLASAFVGVLSFLGIGIIFYEYPIFVNMTSVLAIVIGLITLFGSLVAAGKLHKLLPQKPIIWKYHSTILTVFIAILILTIILSSTSIAEFSCGTVIILIVSIVISSIFGYAFAVRVGGADMPITISLLNSLSGVAGAIAGMAVNDLLLVSVGGLVGASGLFLTQIMCKAMNRNLSDILLGKTSVEISTQLIDKVENDIVLIDKDQATTESSSVDENRDIEIIRSAKSVIIVPGYGMALSQAQHLVRTLTDKFEEKGAEVKFAIHPVAGRMPGHMNVLLAEADVSYEKLYEMDAINEEFINTDVVIVVGANDIINPAARDAKDTPIYGMPVLNVDEAKQVIICNFDTQPGYAGVDNPLYKDGKTKMLLGDAKDSLNILLDKLSAPKSTVETSQSKESELSGILQDAKEVIIVPGYGMALAQAQQQTKQLADKLERQGARVRFAVHPVAGRMPGHMNVLLAEVDVPYDELYEMDQINDDFKHTDLVIVVGANDVINPAAREAVDTPIYGMPVLNVDEAKQVIICNFDTQPGYAGVDNPLYKDGKTILLLGDAKESLQKLLDN